MNVFLIVTNRSFKFELSRFAVRGERVSCLLRLSRRAAHNVFAVSDVL